MVYDILINIIVILVDGKSISFIHLLFYFKDNLQTFFFQKKNTTKFNFFILWVLKNVNLLKELIRIALGVQR